MAPTPHRPAWLHRLWLAPVLLAIQFPAGAMDLLQVYHAALDQDATLRSARAAADSGREKLPQAQAQLYPNIAFSAGRNINDLSRTQANLFGVLGTTQETYISQNQTLTLRQPLFRKPLMVGLAQAHYATDDANATLSREVQNLGMRVSAAYFEALNAQDQLGFIQAQKTSLTAQLDAAKNALAAGSGTRTDIDDAQASLDMTEAQELEARQNVDYTRRQLEALTNQAVGTLAQVDEKRMPLTPPDPASIETWIQRAEDASPEVQSLKARLEMAKLEITKAQGGHYPTLDAVVQITSSASENVTTPSSSYTNRSAGLIFNLPLFSGGYTNSLVRQAIAETTRAQEALEVTRRDLDLRIHKEYRGITEGVLRVKALEQAVRSAGQRVISSQRSLQAGSRTLLDVLDAEQKLQEAKKNLAQARYLYLNARIRLQALAGGDSAQTIENINAGLSNN